MLSAMAQTEDQGFTIDWYNLGCLIYECLTGQPPYNEDQVYGNVQSETLAIP